MLDLMNFSSFVLSKSRSPMRAVTSLVGTCECGLVSTSQFLEACMKQSPVSGVFYLYNRIPSDKQLFL